MFDLKGRVAVVTGASVGLGRGFALALARQGADVAIMARRREKLEKVAEEVRSFGVKCLVVPTDVTKSEDIQAAVKAVVAEYGKVDILVNNAGGGTSCPLEDMPDEAFANNIELDLVGLFKCTREFGKEMLKNNYGRIINIASILGIVGNADVPVVGYHAAKGGVITFTRAAAAEWATRGVTVNSLCPGFFPSESNGDAEMVAMNEFILRNTPMKRPGTPTDTNVVGDLDAALIFLASEESRYVTGVTLPCDGGWTSI